jgi:hypothetical protein
MILQKQKLSLIRTLSSEGSMSSRGSTSLPDRTKFQRGSTVFDMFITILGSFQEQILRLDLVLRLSKFTTLRQTFVEVFHSCFRPPWLLSFP